MRSVRFTRAGALEIEVPLEARDLRVGRSGDNDVVLQDPDKTLSRHHAELRCEGDRWFYLDLNSANGSWVGDRRVARQELTPGVSVSFGDYQISLVEQGSAAEATPDPDATRAAHVDETLVRPAATAPRARDTAKAVTPASARPVTGGAIPVGAPAGPAMQASSPVIRRVIMYGSIVVFGAFAVMLAAMLRPESPPPEGAAAPVAEASPATPTPAPAPTASPSPASETPPAPAPPPTPPPQTAATPAAATPASTPAAAPRNTADARTAPRTPPRRPAERTRPAVDTDPDAAMVPAREGETPAAVQQRRDDLRRRYAQGVQRLSARQFAEARELLAGVSREAPGFRDVAARLGEADTALRQQAAADFKTAARLEESAEWTDALRAYEALQPYAAFLPGLADALGRTRSRMHEAGVQALTRARQFDSRGRVPEAIAWYQRAVAWLPADYPGLEAAKQRLAQLVNRP